MNNTEFHYRRFLLGIRMLTQEEVDRQASGVKEEAGLGGQTLQGNLGTGVNRLLDSSWVLRAAPPRPCPHRRCVYFTSLTWGASG